MSTIIRPELSKKNKYWIDRHRYYELKHFCMQYPLWKKLYLTLDGWGKKPENLEFISKMNEYGDPTARCAMDKAYFSERIEMIERAAADADPELASYILEGVTKGIAYDHLKARLDIPCCKDTYYDRYRRFFWLLSKMRQ